MQSLKLNSRPGVALLRGETLPADPQSGLGIACVCVCHVSLPSTLRLEPVTSHVPSPCDPSWGICEVMGGGRWVRHPSVYP